MSLENDLSRLIRDQFDKNKISYKRSMCLERLTARYLEMATRRIQPVPRDVHFNNDATLTSVVLDRLLHHAETIVIEGKSFRMKDANPKS